MTTEQKGSPNQPRPVKKHLSDKNLNRGAFRNEINIVAEGTPLPSHLEHISSVQSSGVSVSDSTSRDQNLKSRSPSILNANRSKFNPRKAREAEDLPVQKIDIQEAEISSPNQLEPLDAINVKKLSLSP